VNLSSALRSTFAFIAADLRTYFAPLWVWPRAVVRLFSLPLQVEQLAETLDERHRQMRRDIAMLSAGNTQLTAQVHDSLMAQVAHANDVQRAQGEINRAALETNRALLLVNLNMLADIAATKDRGAAVAATLQQLTAELGKSGPVGDEERDHLMRLSNEAYLEVQRIVADLRGHQAPIAPNTGG
jgi:hypothetical protein